MKPSENKLQWADYIIGIMLAFLILLLLLLAAADISMRIPRRLLLEEYFSLRQAPSTESELLQKGQRGDSFALCGLERGEPTAYGSFWYKIRLQDGRTAYVVRSSGGEQQLLNKREYKRYQFFQRHIKPFISFASEEQREVLAQFPPSYRELLEGILLVRPKWKPEPLYVKAGWAEVLEAELEPEDRNLVQYEDTEFFEPYAWMLKHRDKSYDGSNWYPANEEAVAYYLDPRNFLNVRDIFQFLDLSYGASGKREHSDAGVRRIFAGNKALTALTPLVMKAAEKADVMPEVLASRMVQEISSEGGISYLAQGLLDPRQGPLDADSPSPGFLPPEEQRAQLEAYAAEVGEEHLSKELKEALARAGSGERAFAEPAERYYNFFNIGAYPDPEHINGAAMNGARFAAGLFHEKGSRMYEELLLPWNTPERAMEGGAAFIAREYIAAGQDTPYLQKFDLISGTFSHQYMQALFAAQEEGQRLFAVWAEAGADQEELHFRIPVFGGMPESYGRESSAYE